MAEYKPYTHEQVLEKLTKIRDEALDWMLNCAEQRITKGSGVAQLLFEKNQQEITRIEDRLSGHAENKTIIIKYAD